MSCETECGLKNLFRDVCSSTRATIPDFCYTEDAIKTDLQGPIIDMGAIGIRIAASEGCLKQQELQRKFDDGSLATSLQQNP